MNQVGGDKATAQAHESQSLLPEALKNNLLWQVSWLASLACAFPS